jgi:hypothetical protein
MFSAPFLSTLLHRVKAVVRRVVRPRAERARVVSVSATEMAIAPALRAAAHGWMRTKLRALSALLWRIEAGERLDTPVRPARAAKRVDESVERDSIPPEARLPRGFGWMCAFGPHIREDGALFAAWLSEPAMRARVMAAPEHMARTISPILAATGAERPEWFPVAPKRARENAWFGAGRAGCGGDAPEDGVVVDPGTESFEGPPADSKSFERVGDISNLGCFTPPLDPPTRGRVFGACSQGFVPPAVSLRRRGFGPGRDKPLSGSQNPLNRPWGFPNGRFQKVSELRRIGRPGIVRLFRYDTITKMSLIEPVSARSRASCRTAWIPGLRRRSVGGSGRSSFRDTAGGRLDGEGGGADISASSMG